MPMVLVICTAFVGALLQAQTTSVPPRRAITLAPAFTASTLAELPRTAWLTNGGDVFNRRYSPLTQINRENVAGLKAVWRTRLNGSGVGPRYSGEATPIFYEGVLYVATGANDVFALDVDSGDILWSYAANLDPSINTHCCGWKSRGVALGDGRVYILQIDGKIVALDQRTGTVAWSIQAERWEEGLTGGSAPLYYDGLVIVGFAGAERGVRGRVSAYDAKTGALAWRFYTIPGPGEVGHDTWPKGSSVWEHGGATVWQTPAVDPALGLLYFSTANAGPDFNGAVRPGDNLFSASIVAIDVKTGKYRWHFQLVHHDIWDYDMPNPVVLFDLEINGRMRKGLVNAGKTGWAYALDRETGKPLIGIEERPVPQDPRQATARTQPFPIGDAFIPQSIEVAPEGFTLVNQGRIFTPFWTDRVVMKPGPRGGANWPPSSYDPATGYFYVCASDGAGVYSAAEEVTDDPPAGSGYLGGSMGMTGLSAGTLSALDMRTNKLVWQQHWVGICYSGSSVTAGGLLFVGRNDGRFTALNSKDGRLLWSFQTDAGVNAPASIFEHRGQQYVAVYSGGSVFAQSTRGDSVWLFSLQGTLGPVAPPSAVVTAGAPAAAPPAAAAPAAAQTPAVASGPADLANGQRIFNTTCSVCHGDNGQTGHAPSLAKATDRAMVTQVVTQGRNQMPAYGGSLSADAMRDIVAYVIERLPH